MIRVDNDKLVITSLNQCQIENTMKYKNDSWVKLIK